MNVQLYTLFLPYELNSYNQHYNTQIQNTNTNYYSKKKKVALSAYISVITRVIIP